TPGAFQTVEKAAIPQLGQAFGGDGRPGGIADQPFQSVTVAGLNANLPMNAEAGDHRAAGALECVHAVPVDLISEAHDTAARVGTNRSPATNGTGQHS